MQWAPWIARCYIALQEEPMTFRLIRFDRRALHRGLLARASRLPSARALDVPMVRRLGASLLPGLVHLPASEPDRLAPGWLAIDALEVVRPRQLDPIDLLYERALASKRDVVRGVGFLLSLVAILWIVA
jgi:hypothetical protein